jgi:hypothetical protein
MTSFLRKSIGHESLCQENLDSCDHKIRMSGYARPALFPVAAPAFESEKDVTLAFARITPKKSHRVGRWLLVKVLILLVTYFLLDCLQIFLFSASLIRSSRKSG